MKMRKLFAVILALALCMSLFAGCGSEKEEAKVTPQDTAEASVADEAPAAEERSEAAPAAEAKSEAEPAATEEKSEAAPAETEEKPEETPAVPEDDVTVESLMQQYEDAVKDIRSISFNMVMDVDMKMTMMGEEQEVSMNMDVDMKADGDNAYMSGKMESNSYGETEKDEVEQYVIFEDGEYTSYSYDKDTGKWSKSEAQNPMIAQELLPKIDISKFNLETEGTQYVVTGETDMKEMTESMGETFGELFSGMGIAAESFAGTTKVEYRFNKETKDLESMDIDMAEAFEKTLTEMLNSLFASQFSGDEESGENSIDLSSLFEIKVNSFVLKLTGIRINQGEEVVLPAEVAALVADSKDDTSASEEKDKEEPAEEEKTAEKEKGADTEVTVKETVVLDQDGVKITLKSLEEDEYFGPELKFLIENNTDKNITVQARNASVNGYMIDPSMSADVAAGKKANEELGFSTSELEAAGITTIADIEFSFYIMDSETWDEILRSDKVRIETSAFDGFKYEYDNSGNSIYNENGVEIVVKGLSDEDSWIGPSIVVYISNTSGQDLTIQARDVSINGFMVDPYFSCDILDGKHAVDTISFMSSDLEENDIKKIEDAEMSFRIISLESWDTIAETAPIKIAF